MCGLTNSQATGKVELAGGKRYFMYFLVACLRMLCGVPYSALVGKIEEKMQVSSGSGKKRLQASDAVERQGCAKAKAEPKMIPVKSEQVLGAGNC